MTQFYVTYFQSLVKKANAGSLTEIKTLNKHLLGHAPDKSELVVAASAICLGFDTVPTEWTMEESVQLSIRCAIVSMSSLATVAISAPISEIPLVMGVFTEHNSTVFPWLTFLQTHYFHPGSNVDSEGLKEIPADIPSPILEMTLLDLMKFINRAKRSVDLSADHYLTSCVYDLWKKLVFIDIDEDNTDQLSIEQGAAYLVANFIQRIFVQNTPGKIAMYGGVSAVSQLHLAAVEKHLHKMRASKRKPERAYLSLLQAVYHALEVFSFQFLQLVPEIEVIPLVRRLTVAVGWLIDDRPRVFSQYGADSDQAERLDSIIPPYCHFILSCPASPNYYSLEHILHLGIVKKLRTQLPGHTADLETPNTRVFDGLINSVGLLALIFPSTIKYTKRLHGLPTHSSHDSAWESLDRMLEASEVETRMAGVIAKNLDVCRTVSSRVCLILELTFNAAAYAVREGP
ncbi:hypothetical protein ONZ45_g4320 [Pleurotus djamor]|nr:hypothetical protein ONZ45_g4320 [Pleurotus djamor]